MFKFLFSTLMFISYSFVTLADHGPKKMWKRQIVPYFDVHETKMMGPFKINVHAYGKKKDLDAASVKKENFDNIFKDKNNLAVLIRKNNKLVYSRYNKKRKINNNTNLHGMSMSKTAVSTAIGSLLCNGKIESLDDELGKYSLSLKQTPYSKITIRNTLQMNSGVAPIQNDYKLRRKMNKIKIITKN